MSTMEDVIANSCYQIAFKGFNFQKQPKINILDNLFFLL